jgi:hypothetical protein
VRQCGMRKGIIVEVTPADRARLQSIREMLSYQSRASEVAPKFGSTRGTEIIMLSRIMIPWALYSASSLREQLVDGF